MGQQRRVLASLPKVVDAEQADYYLSDSLDVADGTLGRSLLLEVASENQNNYKKFTERLTEKNGSQWMSGLWMN